MNRKRSRKRKHEAQKPGIKNKAMAKQGSEGRENKTKLIQLESHPKSKLNSL